MKSIARLARRLEGRALVGAGTVLYPERGGRGRRGRRPADRLAQHRPVGDRGDRRGRPRLDAGLFHAVAKPLPRSTRAPMRSSCSRPRRRARRCCGPRRQCCRQKFRSWPLAESARRAWPTGSPPARRASGSARRSTRRAAMLPRLAVAPRHSSVPGRRGERHDDDRSRAAPVRRRGSGGDGACARSAVTWPGGESSGTIAPSDFARHGLEIPPRPRRRPDPRLQFRPATSALSPRPARRRRMRRAPISTTAGGRRPGPARLGGRAALTRRATPTCPRTSADQAAAHGFKAIGRGASREQHRLVSAPARPRRRRPRPPHWLEFDGVFRDCLVFVNGYVVGRNESGYAPFRVDITDFLDYDGGPQRASRSGSTRRWAKAGSTKAPASTATSAGQRRARPHSAMGDVRADRRGRRRRRAGARSPPRSLNSGDDAGRGRSAPAHPHAGRRHGRDPARGPARTGGGRVARERHRGRRSRTHALVDRDAASVSLWSASSSATESSSTATRPASASAPSASMPSAASSSTAQPVKLLGVVQPPGPCRRRHRHPARGSTSGGSSRCRRWASNAWRSAHNPPSAGPARHLRRAWAC